MPKKSRNKKPKQSKPMGETIQNSFDVETGCFFHGSFVEIRGQERIEVHGVCKILSYESDCICLALKDKQLTVQGTRLMCQSFLQGVAVIGGHIGGVFFDKRECREEKK